MAIEGLTAARSRLVDDMVFLAHQTASLTAYAYHKPKKMPKLETLLQPQAQIEGRVQTAEEQVEVLKSIFAGRHR